MYNFIDVTEISEGASMPSEALKINGQYIEYLIPGYRTLTVSGREALSPEVTTYETGVRDGSILKGKRYPARTIRIAYQIRANTSEDFRAAYNKLASILNVENAELIFNDEPDKYFIGTPSQIGEVSPGRNCVTGEFDILCLDPFKYSVREYEATVADGETSVLIPYSGTYKSFPTLRAEFYDENETDGETVTPLTGNGDCGYVAFFNENKKIIQLGDPEEIDKEEGAYQKSQTLSKSTFTATNSWGTAAKSLWSLNNGAASSSAFTQSGDFEIGIRESKVHSQKMAVANPNKGEKRKLGEWSCSGKPVVIYTLWGQVLDRNERTATLNFTLQARFKEKTNFMGRGYALQAILGHAGVSDLRFLPLIIKNSDEEWSASNPKEPKVYTFTFKAPDYSLPGGKYSAKIRMDLSVWRLDDYDEGVAGVLSDKTVYLPVDKYVETKPIQEVSYHLSPKNYGTGGNNWVGPSITRKLPADASGETGAVNCSCSFMHTMRAGSGNAGASQRGAFQALLVSGSGTSRKIVAGFQVYKGGASAQNSSLRFYINGATAKTVTIDISDTSGKLNNTTSSIIKTGDTVQFNVGNKIYSFKDEDIATLAVTEITFIFAKHISAPALSKLGLSSVKFAKNNCTTWRDIPNKFSANDVVEADCKEGEIYLNGAPFPALGALGNDWEEFYLTPGLNQIGIAYSEWLQPPFVPRFKVKYREVFL